MSYNFYKIKDMAYDRQTIVNRCGDLGYKFIECFDKIYKNPEDTAVEHWCGELKGWFTQVSRLKFKTNKKLISNEQLVDWFFTDGSDFDMLFNKDKTEQEKYNFFCKDLLITRDIIK